MDAATLVAGYRGDRAVLAKARRKVLEQGLGACDLTPAMRETPRERLRTRALRGHWGAFPVSPEADCDVLGGVIEEARFERGGSFGIAMDLDEVAGRFDAERADWPAERLALWRGLVTAGMEAFEEGLRDSDGEVARYTGEALARYAGLPWENAGLSTADYYQDLCVVCVWDEGAAVPTRDGAVSQGAPPERPPRRGDPLAARSRAPRQPPRLPGRGGGTARGVASRRHPYLRPLRADRRAAGLRLVMPVTAMAERAVAAGRVELAVDVLSAGTSRPGMHRDTLARKCVAITGRPLPPRRHLRALE
jgi:hypothetical protein